MKPQKDKNNANTKRMLFFGIALMLIGTSKLVDILFNFSELSLSVAGSFATVLLNCVVGLYFVIEARRK